MRRIVRHSGIFSGVKERGILKNNPECSISGSGAVPTLLFLTQGNVRKNGGGTTLSSLYWEVIWEFPNKPADGRSRSFGSRFLGARLRSFALFDEKDDR